VLKNLVFSQFYLKIGVFLPSNIAFFTTNPIEKRYCGNFPTSQNWENTAGHSATDSHQVRGCPCPLWFQLGTPVPSKPISRIGRLRLVKSNSGARGNIITRPLWEFFLKKILLVKIWSKCNSLFFCATHRTDFISHSFI